MQLNHIALSSTCKSLRNLLRDQIQLAVIVLKNMRRDAYRTLEIIEREKRRYVRCVCSKTCLLD